MRTKPFDIAMIGYFAKDKNRTRGYLFRHLRGKKTLHRCRTGQSLCCGGHLPQDGGPWPVHGNHEERGDVSEEFIGLTLEVNTPSKWFKRG